MPPEAIKKRVQELAFPAAVLMMQMEGDFNFSSVVRNANAFGFHQVYYCGPKKKWDKRGAVGTYHYTNVEYIGEYEGVKDSFEALDHYSWVALENNVDYEDKTTSLYDFAWPENTLLIVGEEGQGLDDDILYACDDIVTIPQFGSVRSINASTATGIAMNAYAQQQSRK